MGRYKKTSNLGEGQVHFYIVSIIAFMVLVQSFSDKFLRKMSLKHSGYVELATVKVETV